jgi:hypothetical protein
MAYLESELLFLESEILNAADMVCDPILTEYWFDTCKIYVEFVYANCLFCDPMCLRIAWPAANIVPKFNQKHPQFVSFVEFLKAQDLLFI